MAISPRLHAVVVARVPEVRDRDVASQQTVGRPVDLGGFPVLGATYSLRLTLCVPGCHDRSDVFLILCLLLESQKRVTLHVKNLYKGFADACLLQPVSRLDKNGAVANRATPQI
ncbi:hypothetical protein FGB62_35g224 [Gracilaria domingensis]|nr:hypothetical protein FGB62_35g224 [Gracilaria domingensis]